MRRYWWVNHKQTVRQEIAGQYLWSPKAEANGAHSQFYDNMREAAPGDGVLSYANGQIGFIGTVVDYAIAASKPNEFGTIGTYWDTEGWLLPVSWQPAVMSLRPKSMLGQIAPLLPKKYSPINSDTGNGNQKAYLTEISNSLFDLVLARLGQPPLPSGASLPQPNAIEALDDAVEAAINADGSLGDTERNQLVKARRGQGIFRDRLCGIESMCRVTGIDNPLLLIASHIKPWRSCISSTERLDGNNGLLLAPHVDLLFDHRFISFENNGKVIISSRLARDDIKKLGLAEAFERGVEPFNAKQRVYLDYHRRVVLLS